MTYQYGYLGPKGTNCEEALFKYFGEDINANAYQDVDQIFSAVENGEIDYGIVPIENSIEGPVNITLDLLVQNQKAKIIGEVIIPIQHHLLVKKGTSQDDIKVVLSHPQALAQCHQYISELHNIEVSTVKSTAEAAKHVSLGNGEMAAIASKRAAEEYGLQIYVSNIQDIHENATRFIILSRHVKNDQATNKTSIVVCITDRPGGLHEILRQFALANINLVKIESRPTKKGLGDYLFYIDFIGTINEPVIKKCLQSIEKMSVLFKVLGTYEAWNSKERAQGHDKTTKKIPTLGELREDVDIIDFQIVELIAQRTRLVEQIGYRKIDRDIAKDPEREQKVLNRVKKLAVEKEASPELLEKVYKVLFDFFVNLQEKMAEKNSK